MKFTSQNLLNAMGLKVNDVFYMPNPSYKYKVVLEEGRIYVKDFIYQEYMLIEHFIESHKMINREYTIIQPTPTLTEDEKVILRNVNAERIGREMVQDHYSTDYEWLYLVSGEFKYDFSVYNHIFKSVEMCGEYSIEELLGEKV